MAVMQEGTVVSVSADLAIAAARVSLQTRLPMADSVILATSRLFDATLWTQDADFKGMRGVRYVPKT
jgi:predicted nucleic acid-binding protein